MAICARVLVSVKGPSWIEFVMKIEPVAYFYAEKTGEEMAFSLKKL